MQGPTDPILRFVSKHKANNAIVEYAWSPLHRENRKLSKEIPVKESKGWLEIWQKHSGMQEPFFFFFFFTNIVNSLIVTIQDIAIFAANCSIYFYETVCQVSFFQMKLMDTFKSDRENSEFKNRN